MVIGIVIVYIVITSPTEDDGRLCFRRRQYIYIYVYVYVNFVNNFLMPIQVWLSPNFVRATGDEVIKFWKVKVGRGGMHSIERPSSCC